MAPRIDLRRLIPRSTAARVGIAAFFVLLFAHMLGYFMAFVIAGPESLRRGLEERVGHFQAARAAAAVRALDAISAAQRADVARLLSDRAFAVSTIDTAAPCENAKQAGPMIARLAMDLDRPGRGICLVNGAIQVPLLSGGAARFELRAPAAEPSPIQRPGFWHVVVSLVLAAGAAFGIRALTRPFADFASAAERLGVDPNAPPMSEGGPIEVMTAVKAFNAMQRRIQRFVADRTQMIAAISHDLRTPITRLRLRAEFVADSETQAAINRDLDEMEGMVNATLDFVQTDLDPEAAVSFDLGEKLRYLAQVRQSVGQKVTFTGGARPYVGRPLQLARAFSNLIDNAIKYGGEAEITLTDDSEGPEIRIEDRGPGIPPAERERVFRPFYRIETSRSRQTGGVGLGLNVARSIIVAHGGSIELGDRVGGGLTVTVRLGEPIALRSARETASAAAD